MARRQWQVAILSQSEAEETLSANRVPISRVPFESLQARKPVNIGIDSIALGATAGTRRCIPLFFQQWQERVQPRGTSRLRPFSAGLLFDPL